jgi:hypothetical protein
MRLTFYFLRMTAHGLDDNIHVPVRAVVHGTRHIRVRFLSVSKLWFTLGPGEPAFANGAEGTGAQSVWNQIMVWALWGMQLDWARMARGGSKEMTAANL